MGRRVDAPSGPTSEGTESVEDTSGVAFGQVVRMCAALAAAGAGVVHLDAAGDHKDHWQVVTFFVVVGVVQLLWAATAARQKVDRRVFASGLLFNAGVLGVWIVSRTVGLPDVIPDVGGVEAIGWKDAAASGLAFALLAAGGIALTMPPAAANAVIAPRSGERILRAMVVATLAVTVPGALASHEHGAHGHGEGARHHVDGDLASAVEVREHGEHSSGSDDETHVDAEVIEGDDPHAATTSEEHAAPHAAAGVVHVPAADHAHASGATTPADSSAAGHDDAGAHDASGHGGHEPASTGITEPVIDPLEGPGEVTTVRVGPFALLPQVPGMKMPHLPPGIPRIAPGELNLVPLYGIPQPCQDCYVLGMQPDLVYIDGTPANLDTGPMLHHAVWSDPGSPDPVCSGTAVGSVFGHRIFASGNERTGFAAPEGFGVPLDSGMWGGAVELMNMSNELRLVYVQLTARWMPRSTPGIEPVTPVWLDIDSCGDSAVDIPAGVNDVTWDWTSNVTGRIVTAGGHVHDGGEWIGLTNATTGEPVCNSVAGYGTKPQYMGAIDSMSVCRHDRLATVRSGEVLRLNAHYNTTEPSIGAMGIMVIFVHPTADLAGGSPSPYPATPPADGEPPAGHAHAH